MMRTEEEVVKLRNFLLTKISCFAYKYESTDQLLLDIGKLNGLNYALNPEKFDTFYSNESEVK